MRFCEPQSNRQVIYQLQYAHFPAPSTRPWISIPYWHIKDILQYHPSQSNPAAEVIGFAEKSTVPPLVLTEGSATQV